MTATDPSAPAQPATPGQALRWVADMAGVHGTVTGGMLLRWADELDAAPATVTELWDAHGDKWDRGEGTDRWWSELHGRWVTWPHLLAFFGPLSAAPPAGTEADYG